MGGALTFHPMSMPEAAPHLRRGRAPFRVRAGTGMRAAGAIAAGAGARMAGSRRGRLWRQLGERRGAQARVYRSGQGHHRLERLPPGHGLGGHGDHHAPLPPY